MIPSSFEYHAPSSIEDALKLLDRYGDDCKILSGGHSLVPVLKLKLAAPAAIVDIGRIDGLKGIAIDGDMITIGANTTHAEIAASPVLRAGCPLLSETAAQIGDQQVRNRGTIGGSLTHADPAADWPAAILALDAEIDVRSSSGARTIRAVDFFIDIMTSAVGAGEIVTRVRIRKPAEPRASAYLKVAQSASGFAVVGVAVQLAVSGGKCLSASIGVTGLAPRPFRAASAEAEIAGKAIEQATVVAASAKADAEASDVMEDIHASGEFRRNLARVYTRRAIEAAASRA